MTGPGHRGRFAPSPTGRLHLGNARSALLGWLWARRSGGQFLLRIEDLDRQRSKPERVDELLRDLEYLGLHWDGTPVFQSARGEAYDEALAKLSARGDVYPCYCSRAEVARAASAPHGPSDDGPVYPGTCAQLGEDLRAVKAAARPAALRFRARAGTLCFEDGVHGQVCQDVEKDVGDFVVRRADGVASYQLAVVVDDANSGITHVLRADDLLLSTPRQLQLYAALELEAPAFAHVPLVLGEDGRRLAKREGAFAVTELREAGVPAERVLGLLAGWSGLGDTPRQAQELVEGFELDGVPKAPVSTSEADIRRALGLGA